MDLLGAPPASTLKLSAFASLARLFSRALDPEAGPASPVALFWAAALSDDPLAFDRAVADPMTLMRASADASRSPLAALARRAAEFDAAPSAQSPVLKRLLAVADLDAPVAAARLPQSEQYGARLGRNERLLHWAVALEHSGLARALLASGANPDGRAGDLSAIQSPDPTVSPLCLAFEANNLNLATELAEAGATLRFERLDDPRKSFKNIGQAILRRAHKAVDADAQTQSQAWAWLEWGDARHVQLPVETALAQNPDVHSDVSLALAARQALTALDVFLARAETARGQALPFGAFIRKFNAPAFSDRSDKESDLFFSALNERSPEKLAEWSEKSEDQGNPVSMISRVSVFDWIALAVARDVLRKPASQSYSDAMEPMLAVLKCHCERLSGGQIHSPALGSGRQALATLLPREAFLLLEKSIRDYGPWVSDLEQEACEEAVSVAEIFARKEQRQMAAVVAEVGVGATRETPRESVCAPDIGRAAAKSRRL